MGVAILDWIQQVFTLRSLVAECWLVRSVASMIPLCMKETPLQILQPTHMRYGVNMVSSCHNNHMINIELTSFPSALRPITIKTIEQSSTISNTVLAENHTQY